MKKQIIKSIALGFLAVLVIAGVRFVPASAQGEGDYVIVTVNGSETYEVESLDPKTKVRTKRKVYRHGRIVKGTVYYVDPNEGVKSIPLASVKVRKFTMPGVGETFYVLDESGVETKVLKATVKSFNTYPEAHNLLPFGEIAGETELWKGFNYATEEEFEDLGWKLYDAKNAGKFVDVAEADLHKLEQEAFEMVNEARHDPEAFADKIEKLYKPDDTVAETLRFLRNIAKNDHKFGALRRDPNLDKAARDHAFDLAAHPTTEHRGTSKDCSIADNGWVACRLERYGVRKGGSAENIYQELTGGALYTGSKAVMNLTLDHGVVTRGHRAGFFDEPEFNETFDDARKFTMIATQIGIGAGYDKTTGWITIVFNFANNYEGKN